MNAVGALVGGYAFGLPLPLPAQRIARIAAAARSIPSLYSLLPRPALFSDQIIASSWKRNYTTSHDDIIALIEEAGGDKKQAAAHLRSAARFHASAKKLLNVDKRCIIGVGIPTERAVHLRMQNKQDEPSSTKMFLSSTERNNFK